MARLNTAVSSTPGRESSAIRDPTPGVGDSRRKTRHSAPLAPLSPSPGLSSDKENCSPAQSAQSKRDGRMGPPKLPTPTSDSYASPRCGKRRKIQGAFNIPPASQVASAEGGEAEDFVELHFYDPNQPEGERRDIKRQSRALEREFNEKRDEFLSHDTVGLQHTIQRADRIFKGVKQTADATLDSRLFVSISDLTYKKSAQLSLGNTLNGIDVDEFVSKCIGFMNRGLDTRDNNNNRHDRDPRRRTRDLSTGEGDQDEEANDGEALDWELLGLRACFPNNARPPVPGFLLGPLSVQKRVRTQTQRRSRNAKEAETREARPETLTKEDLDRNESKTLTSMCTKIRRNLERTIGEAGAAIEKAQEHDDLDEASLHDLMRKRHISSDGGLGLFDFVIHPHSFGQTIENLFYISFLIKEGSIGIGKDAEGMPTLHATNASTLQQQRERGTSKHQAVFSLDWPTWQILVEALDIVQPMIPHRSEEQQIHPNARGWYG
ncbi:hypothetical protein LTR66_006687 [Elasticomyces elasticus]|nr:hypothetical protein LTR66_006687 [Elasticomyces elasticus]KAK5006122.1 hypothetical protein LTR28_006876 [Elasticomyces elasticus]